MKSSVIDDQEVLDELGLSETEARIIKAVMEKYDEEDKVERERSIRMWKELELFFRGFQNLLWDDVSKVWIESSGQLNSIKREEEINPDAYEKIVNIYRAHLESIIAAVSANTPRTKFFPEDADDPDDIRAAKTSVKVVEKIERDNSMALKFIHSLFIIVNQGLVYAYTYYHHSEEYGLNRTPIEGLVESTITKYYCEYCATELPNDEVQMCPNCGEKTVPEAIEENTEEIDEVDEIKSPKGKACVDIYGPLNVKIPFNLTSLRYSPYLRLETDQYTAYLEDLYPHLRGKLTSSTEEGTERRGRNQNPTGSNNENQETLKIYWLRPWALNIYGKNDTEEVEALKARFPSGIKVCSVAGHLASIEEESLDEHWTCTESPLAATLHAEPYGKPLKPLQQMENELVALTLQTVQFGIPELFADPRIVDFDAYRKNAAKPGMMYPMKVPVGERAESKFYRHQPATLSKEVNEFQAYLDARAQFVSGAFPAVFGGPQSGGSGTFSEYEMSRNQALQRLQILWKILNDWYPRFMAKATKVFIKNMQNDENYVKQQGTDFVNETIRRDDLVGKLGEAFSESSEQFPVTWPQIRGMIMELLNLKEPFINAALAHPENVGFMAKAFGMGGLQIPGAQDRDKELRIIQELLNSAPVQGPDPNFIAPPQGSDLALDNPQAMIPPMIPVSSVPVDNDIDNHAVCIATIQHWAVSEVGIEAQKNNPTGYENVKLHLREHIAALKMQSAPPQAAGNANPQTEGEIPPIENPPNDSVGLA